MVNESDLTWIDPGEIPDAAHLLHHSNVWCVVNSENKVLVFGMGTGPRDANSLQGSRHKVIAERFIEPYHQFGAVGVALVPHVFLPDSPGRY